MNNKKIGTEFEHEMVMRLAKHGYWVHFLSPDQRGAQPFDLIAAKDGVTIVGDCKTCQGKTFSMSRLEDNQITAFQRWIACGNGIPLIFIKHEGNIYLVGFKELYEKGKVKINDLPCWK